MITKDNLRPLIPTLCERVKAHNNKYGYISIHWSHYEIDEYEIIKEYNAVEYCDDEWNIEIYYSLWEVDGNEVRGEVEEINAVYHTKDGYEISLPDKATEELRDAIQKLIHSL